MRETRPNRRETIDSPPPHIKNNRLFFVRSPKTKEDDHTRNKQTAKLQIYSILSLSLPPSVTVSCLSFLFDFRFTNMILHGRISDVFNANLHTSSKLFRWTKKSFSTVSESL